MEDIKINKKVDFIVTHDSEVLAVLIGGNNMLDRLKQIVSDHFVGEAYDVAEATPFSGQNEHSESYKFLVTLKGEITGDLDDPDEYEDVYEIELERVHCYYPEPI